MAKKKAAFKGLVAYNYVVSKVKANLDKQNVQLKKGKVAGLAPDCSFRDVVKKAWAASKGKQKRSINKIVAGVVADCQKAIEGQAAPAPAGTENIADFLHYWELENYLSDKVPEGSQVVIDNSAFGGIPDMEGLIEDVETDLSEIFAELNAVSNNRAWDSSSAASYTLYYDEGNDQYVFKLQDNEGRGIDPEPMKDRQARELTQQKDEDLTKKTGKAPEEKVKPVIDVVKEEESKREKIKTKELEKRERLKTEKVEYEKLMLIKEDLRGDIKEALEDGDKKEAASLKKELQQVKARMKQLRK